MMFITNREGTRERQKQVLTLMFEASAENGCIFVDIDRHDINKPRECVEIDREPQKQLMLN